MNPRNIDSLAVWYYAAIDDTAYNICVTNLLNLEFNKTIIYKYACTYLDIIDKIFIWNWAYSIIAKNFSCGECK